MVLEQNKEINELRAIVKGLQNQLIDYEKAKN